MLLVVLGLLPTLGLMIFEALEARREAVATTRRDVAQVARVLSGTNERLIESSRALLGALARLPAVQAPGSEGCARLLADLLEHDRRYLNMGVVDLAGNVVCSAVPVRERVNLGDRRYIRHALATREFAIGEYQIGRIVPKPMLAFGQAVLDGDGVVRGVVYASLSLDWLNRLFATDAILPDGSTLTVTDHAGVVLARFPDPNRWVGRAASGPSSRRVTEADGIVESRDDDGVARLYAFTRLAGAAANEVYVRIGVPEDVALAPAHRGLVRHAVVLGLGLGLAVLAACVGAEVVVVRRVRYLLDATRRVASGERGVRTRVSAGAGELDRLARAFDEMAAALERREIETEEAQSALQERNRALASLVQASPLAIVVADRDARLTVVNPAAELLLGACNGEMPGHHVEGLEPVLRRALDAEVVTGAAVSLRCADGRRVDVTVSAAPLGGAEARAMAVIADVTEQRRLEAELHQSQKTEAIGRLAGGIAHDFNNLLTIILGRSERLLERCAEDRHAAREVGIVIQTTQRAARLTRQLLAFARRQRLQPRVLDLNAVVIDMHRLLRHLIGEHIELTTLLRASPSAVHADPGQLEQVIVNLALNARDAMVGGGRLTIETSNVDVAEDQDVARRVEPGRYVGLVVTDTGPGIPAEHMSHIFEPFFTTKARGKGTGLGLATVHGIVKQSGGDVAIESAPGRGVRVTILFPVSREPVEQAEGEPCAAPTAGSETVLVVEDEAEVRALAREALTSEGYAVIDAGAGEEALRVAEAHRGVIHLLLADVVMPRMGGAETARVMRTVRPDMKVLFMSGYVDDADRAALDEGTAFLAKPFTRRDLAHKVREVLDAM